MRVIESLRLKNVVVFKDVTFPMNYKGISIIRGYNKDADKQNAEDNTNAAGKTLLFSALSNVLRGTTAVTQDIKSRAKKDMFTEKDSSIEVKAAVNKLPVEVEKKAKGKGLEYKLHENGKDLKARGIAYCESKIQEWFPYNDDEFFTLYFIHSGRPNSLQYGSPSQRMAFFTELFRLDNYDEVRKILNSKLTDIKNHDANRLKMIKDDLSDLKSEIDGIDSAALKAELKELTAQQTSLNSELHELYEKSSKLNIIQSNQSQYGKLVKLSAKLEIKMKSEAQLRKEIERQQKELRRLSKLQKEIEAYKDYVSDRKAFDKKKAELENKISDLKKRLKGFDKKEYKALEKEYIKVKSQLEDIDYPQVDPEIVDTLKDAKKELKKKSKGKEKKEIALDVSKFATKQESNQETIDELEKIEGHSDCPTCKQNINPKTIKKMIRTLEKENAELETDYKKSKDLLELFNKVERLEEKAQAWKDAQSEIEKEEKLKARKRLVKSKLEKLVKLNTLHKKLEGYESHLKDLEPPVEVDKPEVSSVDSSEIKHWINLAESIAPVFSSLLEYADVNVEKELKSLDKASKKLKAKLSKCNDKIPSLTSKISLYKSTKRKISKLKKERKELETKLEDLPVLNMLTEAYSNKGLKLLVIKQIAAMLEKNMNHFAPLLYKERVQFVLDVAENKFDILIKRTKGKKRSYDVRNLSGMEGRVFSFLLPLSILPLIPESRRLNFMVLDEPTVNLDNSTVELFTKSFIPKLRSVVPHIIIVTPLNDAYPKAREYTVIKENGYSTLVGKKDAGRLIS